jgi:mannosyltransferase
VKPSWAARITRNENIIWLVLVLLAGTVLRFYHLGKNSFWLDEAGVAYAARAATIPAMLQVVRSHVLAMPLDYLVAWLFGRISSLEGVLRIPSAIWGSASLVIAYCFYRKFIRPAPALFGVLILALSPFHIQYSQELRFYASLVFFYLLSSFLLWQAVQQPTPKSWAIATAATILGIYFHPYVIFVLANGLIWVAFSPLHDQQARTLRVSFLVNVTIGLLAFLAGYLIFSASNPFRIPLMVFEESPLSAVATGLGWLPFYSGVPGLSWVWGILCAVLEIGGAVTVIAQQPRSPLAGLLYSVVMQIVAIFGSDLVLHYFFAPRQFLMFFPILSLFAGLGISEGIRLFIRWVQTLHRKLQVERFHRLATALIAIIIFLASLPAIQAYYQDDKGSSRFISQMVLQEWRPGDTILVVPGYEGFVYKYYIENEYQRQDAAQKLYVIEWKDLATVTNLPGNLFIITTATITPDETEQLHSLGLSPRYSSYPGSRYARVLWTRTTMKP